MMKKLALRSLITLFSCAIYANNADVVLESKSDLEITSLSPTHGIIAGKYDGKDITMDGITYKNISVKLDSEDNSKAYQLHGGIVRVRRGTLTV